MRMTVGNYGWTNLRSCVWFTLVREHLRELWMYTKKPFYSSGNKPIQWVLLWSVVVTLYHCAFWWWHEWLRLNKMVSAKWAILSTHNILGRYVYSSVPVASLWKCCLLNMFGLGMCVITLPPERQSLTEVTRKQTHDNQCRNVIMFIM